MIQGVELYGKEQEKVAGIFVPVCATDALGTLEDSDLGLSSVKS